MTETISRPKARPVRAKGADGTLRVVLGPTNTGKTHLAVERMLGHSSGMIGLPLRLLAREIYDRVVAEKGPASVALITGEEKILPEHARYFVCTVEAMPINRDVAFLAVDEVQLCADPDRGHVFTDRLLHARGREETMFMGAATVRHALEQVLPEAEFITRPRFSELTYTAPRKLSRLPHRSAVVAFSVPEVYAMAEMLRRQRGGAAVVLGALSPRTRNAQAELYQNGDVDYLVATDAIGMGLNMDIGHVAFAAATKFDGTGVRGLTAAEVGQIAGRAGRHMASGSFGLIAEAEGPAAFDQQMIEAVEQHRFKPVRTLLWRNADLDFASPLALIRSLEAVPEGILYRRGREASDLAALRWIDRAAALDGVTFSQASTRRLWDACQIPDFRKVSPQDHARLCLNVFEFLTGRDEVLPEDWLDRQIKALERVDGTIDTLMQRIAYIRTWTYAANRPDWLADPGHWQERTRAVEDRLSDALHDRLRQRFVDRRTAVLMRELRRKDSLMTVVHNDGKVTVEGHFIGALEGFRFVPDETAMAEDDKTLRHAADRALAQEIANRAGAMVAGDDSAFSLELAEVPTDARILWNGVAVARFQAGDSPLRPCVELLPAPLLTGDPQRQAEERLNRWIGEYFKGKLAPLYRLDKALGDPDCITGLARGLAFQLVENLGTLPRERVAQEFREVDKDGRRQMRSLGIWLGAASFYLPQILKPEAARLRLLLWAMHQNARKLPAPPAPGLITIPTEEKAPATYYEMLGFRAIGGLAVRLDMLERLATAARDKWTAGPFAHDPGLMSLVGVSGESFLKIMRHLGYRYREPSAKELEAWEARQAEDKNAEKPEEQTSKEENEAKTEVAAPAPVETVQDATTQDATAPAEMADQPTDEPATSAEEPEATQPDEPFKLFFREFPRQRRPHARPGPEKKARPRKQDAGRQDTRKPGGKPKRQPPRKKPQQPREYRDKTVPEDSPFAVLAELKKAMSRK